MSVSTLGVPLPGSGVELAKAPTERSMVAVEVTASAPTWMVARSAPAQYWAPESDRMSGGNPVLLANHQSLSTTSTITWNPGVERGMFTQASKYPREVLVSPA